jgi:ABC-type uncharacterized transport system substrate-binding protein
MRRREIIAGIAGSVAVWPLVARAQQPAMPVIGFLRSTSFANAAHLVVAFRQGLKEAGFVEGQNVASIEFRAAEDHIDRLPVLAADLIRRSVAVIVGNTPAALAAKAATATVPIVFTSASDPVRDGLVASLNRPGGNVTGVVFFGGVLGPKRLALLRKLVPKAATIGVLIYPNTSEAEAERLDVLAAAKAIGQQLVILDISSERDIEPAFATFIQRGASALLVGSSPFMIEHRERLAMLATRHGLPAIYSLRDHVVAGGLMSYGSSNTEAYRQAGVYAGRILKGEKPTDLPVMRSTRFEFVLNLKTAKALGLDVPPTLLALTDEVIE